VHGSGALVKLGCLTIVCPVCHPLVYTVSMRETSPLWRRKYALAFSPTATAASMDVNGNVNLCDACHTPLNCHIPSHDCVPPSFSTLRDAHTLTAALVASCEGCAGGRMKGRRGKAVDDARRRKCLALRCGVHCLSVSGTVTLR